MESEDKKGEGYETPDIKTPDTTTPDIKTAAAVSQILPHCRHILINNTTNSVLLVQVQRRTVSDWWGPWLLTLHRIFLCNAVETPLVQRLSHLVSSIYTLKSSRVSAAVQQLYSSRVSHNTMEISLLSHRIFLKCMTSPTQIPPDVQWKISVDIFCAITKAAQSDF